MSESWFKASEVAEDGEILEEPAAYRKRQPDRFRRFAAQHELGAAAQARSAVEEPKDALEEEESPASGGCYQDLGTGFAVQEPVEIWHHRCGHFVEHCRRF